jgi:hypothetical protein
MASLPERESYKPSYNIVPDDSANVFKYEHTFNLEALRVPLSMRSFYEDKVPTNATRLFRFGFMGVEKEIKNLIRIEG